MKSIRSRTATFALGICVTALVATWVAWAQVGSGGTVVGCVDASGKIRAVDETTGQCKAGDVTLSWYTKDGANALFLGKTAKAADADNLDGLDSTAFLRAGAKAPDADLLDGLDSTEFLRNGVGAGGALTGTYPNPSMAAGAIDTNALQNGAVTAEKLAPGVAARNFGDTTRFPGSFFDPGGGLTPKIACGENNIGSTTITVNSPSRIYAQASVSSWSRGSTAQSTIFVQAFLWDSTDSTILARTPQSTAISVPGNENGNYSVSGVSSGVLIREDNFQPFIATPGTYKLHFHVTALGSCFQNDTSFLDGSLTYILLGTSP